MRAKVRTGIEKTLYPVDSGSPGSDLRAQWPRVRVYLLRHADADAEIPDGLGDEARTLVTKARPAVLAHFRGLAERIGKLELVLTSPLTRCVQTSQLLVQALGYDGALRTHRALLPDMPVGALDTLLRHAPDSPLALVGHQPSMGSFCAYLLGMSNFPKPFVPGTVVGLDVTLSASQDVPLTSKLVFYAPPGQTVLETV